MGEGFLADAGRILAMMECARRNADDILSGEKAKVRLGVCPGVISAGILTNLLSRPRERHPHLLLIPETQPPRDLLERLLDGRLDGIVSVSCGLDYPPNVTSITLQPWDAVLVMSHQTGRGRRHARKARRAHARADLRLPCGRGGAPVHPGYLPRLRAAAHGLPALAPAPDGLCGRGLRRVFEVLGEIAALHALYPAPDDADAPALGSSARL